MKSKRNHMKQEKLMIETLFEASRKLNPERMQNAEYVYEWAKMNGVLFLLALCLKVGETDTSEENRLTRLHHEQQLMAKHMAEEAHRLISLFQGQGIRLLPIKTFLQFPYVDHDLDIVIVDNNRLGDYREILLSNGYSYLKSRSSLREPKKRFYIPTDPAKSNLRVHIHFALSWNGVDYLDIHDVWERRRSIETEGFEIPIPSVEDELLIMAAHAVHENKYILMEEVLQLRELSKIENIDWNYIVESAKKYNWLSGLYLFYAIANEIMEELDQRKAFPQEILNTVAADSSFCSFLEKKLTSRDRPYRVNFFPVIMPFFLTSSTYFHKLLQDLKIKGIKEMFREFISYTIVDWAVFWRFKMDLERLKRLKKT